MIRMIKPRRIRSIMDEKRNAYEVLVGKRLKEINCLK
jgi:hypothetical protein